MTRSLTLTLIIFAAVLAGAMVYVLVSPGASGNAPMARVDGASISRAQFEAALLAAHGGEALRDLVDRRVVEELAKKKGLKADPDRIESLMSQEEMRVGGPDRLDERLAEEGRSRDDLRRELAGRALADALLESEVQVSEAEIKAYYEAHRDEFRRGEMVKARLMLLDTRANAQALVDVLDEPGADFAGLARELSLDPATKDQGGDMGWIERGDYAKELTDAAFRLEPGRRTGIVEYPDGFAIILVEARKPGGRQSLDEVRSTIESLLHNQKLTSMRYTWPAAQRKQATVAIPDPSLRRAYDAVRAN
jgi:parvulin-like peptidyl-prolyl isomerase